MIDKKSIRKQRARSQKRALDKLAASMKFADDNTINWGAINVALGECASTGAVVPEEVQATLKEWANPKPVKQERKPERQQERKPKTPWRGRIITVDAADEISSAILGNTFKQRRSK